MAVAWSPFAAPALLGCLVSWLFAAFVLGARPGASSNRRLALLLVVEGIVILALNGGQYVLASVETVTALYAVGTFAVAAKPSVYLHFLATLDTPLVRPLRTRAGKATLLAMSFGGALWFVLPDAFLGAVVPGRHSAWETQPGFLLRPVALLLALLYVLGLAFALSALRRAPSAVSKARARAYALAFCARDGFFLLWAVAFALVPFDHALWPHMYVSIAIMPLVFVPLVAYGMLKAQLFDVDLRIKHAMRRGLIGSAFLLAFFAASEMAETLFETALGPYVGLTAAGALTLALRPLERLAKRVTDSAMPHASREEPYLRARKLDVYRAALEEATQDTEITPRERSLLARLRRELDIDAADADALERDVARARQTAW